MKKETILVVASSALVYIVWGSTCYFIRDAVTTIPAAVMLGMAIILYRDAINDFLERRGMHRI